MEKVNVNLQEQKVEVTTNLTSDEIMEIIKKTGKEVMYVKSHDP